jgi:DNA-binding CsgD family transcriptional regulator
MLTTNVARAHSLIDSLSPNLSSETLENIKRDLRSVIDGFAAVLVESGDGNSNGGLHTRLSPREAEVMKMMLAGKRLKEIAADLDISVKTVTTHRARLLRKLNVADNLGLFRYGVRNGLLSV